MSAANERRERYVKAIEDAYWSHGLSWEGPAVDAVLALADAEIYAAMAKEAGDAAGEARDEIQRLHRELEDTQRALRFETAQLAAEKAYAARLRSDLRAAV